MKISISPEQINMMFDKSFKRVPSEVDKSQSKESLYKELGINVNLATIYCENIKNLLNAISKKDEKDFDMHSGTSILLNSVDNITDDLNVIGIFSKVATKKNKQ